MGSCAVCLCEFDTVSKKKKRKLLYGYSCATELSILESIISNKQVVLSEVSESALRNNDALLCDGCQRNLLKCKSLEEELSKMISNICSKISVTGKAMHIRHKFIMYIYSNVYIIKN